MPVIKKKQPPDCPDLWGIDIQIRSKPLSDATATVIFQGYNAETGAIDDAYFETMQVASVGALIQADPTGPMAQAWAALVAAMKAEYERQNP